MTSFHICIDFYVPLDKLTKVCYNINVTSTASVRLHLIRALILQCRIFLRLCGVSRYGRCDEMSQSSLRICVEFPTHLRGVFQKRALILQCRCASRFGGSLPLLCAFAWSVPIAEKKPFKRTAFFVSNASAVFGQHTLYCITQRTQELANIY